MTHQQGEHILGLVSKTNDLLKRFIHNTPHSRKKIKFHDGDERSCIQSTAMWPVTKTLCGKRPDTPVTKTKEICEMEQFGTPIDLAEADANKLQPCSSPCKSKKVLHVVDSHDSILKLINPIGFWTLEYHVTGAKSVSLFVPSPSTWFNEYVDKASPMHEPTNMSDCMIQIMPRHLHHYTRNSCVFVVTFVLAIEKA